MEKKPTVKEIIANWPTRQVLADDVDANIEAVHKWAQSNSIPARYHAAVLRSATQRGIALTAEEIVAAHDVATGQVAAE